MNSIYLFERGADASTVAIERVSVVEVVCHDREGLEGDFFYMYACMFTKLHVRLPLDEFTMGVLRLLSVAPTQLHPNSWGSLQAFRLICRALYLSLTPESFLYFYVTRLRDPLSWVSLVGKPRISLLDGFTRSFKKFKDGFYRVRVLLAGRLLYYDNEGQLKFLFYWMSVPARRDAVVKEALDADSRRVVEVLETMPIRVPGKWVVCSYLTDNHGLDICGMF